MSVEQEETMSKNELKCKLEQVASGMGYEVKKKIDEELNPIHRLFQILIIFGFLTVFLVMGSFVSIAYMYKDMNNCCKCQHKQYKQEKKDII
jgi:hypothetical protein